MITTAEKLEKIIAKIMIAIAVICLSAATIIIFSSAILRYCFGIGWNWMEEVSRYCCIAAAFFLAGHVFFWNDDITLSLVVTILQNKSEKAVRIIHIFNAVVVALACVYISYYAWILWYNAAGAVTYSQNFPMRVPYAIMPIGMSLMAVGAVLKLIVLFKDKEMRYMDRKGTEFKKSKEDADE